MARACFFVPHPDDETLSMALRILDLLAWGFEVHVVFMSRGGVTAASVKLDGTSVCGHPNHGYAHSPAFEGYVLPTQEEVGEMRLREGLSAVGAMAMITPNAGASPGVLYTHDENLPLDWGCGGCGSSTTPPTEAGIAAADTVIRKWISALPNTFFYTMSPTDAHHDHAACGIALRRLKGVPVYGGNGNFTFTGGDPDLGPLLVNAQFFVSKLYWNTPAGQPGSRLSEYCAWYPNFYPANNQLVPRRVEFTTWLRQKVTECYYAWAPADGVQVLGDGSVVTTKGVMAIGGHQVNAQFQNNILDPSLPYVSALWHP